MLRELRLRNVGVVAEADVEFGPGLNVLTGETGVGKTLLVTSVGLVCGGRAPARLVPAGGPDAFVEAVVELRPELRSALAGIGLDETPELIMARRVGSDGRTKAWVDGRLVPLSVLAEIGDALVELHGQGAGFALARTATQLAALDALAGNADTLSSYTTARHQLRELQIERAHLLDAAAARERESELLAFQADEIERAELVPGEDAEIAEELSRLENAERLAEAAARASELTGADGAAGAIAEAHRALEDVAAVDSRVASLAARLGEVSALVTDAAWDIRTWSSSLDGDPSRIDVLRERRALIASLKRKYGATVDEVIAAGVAARNRLADLEAAGDRARDLDGAVARIRADTQRLADKLSHRRRAAAKKLTDMVARELPALALGNGVFEAECAASDEWTSTGRDRVEFRFSESRGRVPGPIGQVASGGELSRAMIAVTLALATAHAVPILVFDEADQGVGGEAALEVARRLARLGRTHQVLVVSHLPQIAAFADRHIALRRTQDGVAVDVVTAGRRVAEISRMLAGLESSSLARAHAGELIELAGRERAG